MDDDEIPSSQKSQSKKRRRRGRKDSSAPWMGLSPWLKRNTPRIETLWIHKDSNFFMFICMTLLNWVKIVQKLKFSFSTKSPTVCNILENTNEQHGWLQDFIQGVVTLYCWYFSIHSDAIAFSFLFLFFNPIVCVTRQDIFVRQATGTQHK